MDRREQPGAGRRHLVSAQRQAIQAALEAAEILHAGDDFLAGIAALLEADPADRLQVDHLWDEQLAGSAEHLADAGAHLAEQPIVERRLAAVLAERGKHRLGTLRRNPQLDAGVAQGDGEQVAVADDPAALRRCLDSQGAQYLAGVTQADAEPGCALVGKAGLGEYGVFLQVRQLGLEQLAGHRQQQAVALGQDAEAR